MTSAHSLLFYLHVVFGSAALLLFWIPALMKKGSIDHIKFGGYYANVMYTVAVTGALMAVMVLYNPLAIHGHKYTHIEDQQALTTQLRIFWSLLLYLSLLTFTSIRHGILVLRCKKDRSALRRPAHLVFTSGLLLGGIATLSAGIANDKTLLMIFGTLGMFISIGMLRYSFVKAIKPNQWWIEHLGALIGSAIGAYTAFFAFGGRVIVENFGQWQTLFWISPGIIGSIIIARLSRKYRSKFKHNESTTS